MSSKKALFFCLFAFLLAGPVMLGQSAVSGGADQVLLHTMQGELDRAMTSLAKADPAPYFISYAANEDSGDIIMASNGALVANANRH